MEKVPQDWIPLNEAVDFVKERIMANGSNFVLDNFEYKYTVIRVNMSTGSAIILPGNKHE